MRKLASSPGHIPIFPTSAAILLEIKAEEGKSFVELELWSYKTPIFQVQNEIVKDSYAFSTRIPWNYFFFYICIVSQNSEKCVSLMSNWIVGSILSLCSLFPIDNHVCYHSAAFTPEDQWMVLA